MRTDIIVNGSGEEAKIGSTVKIHFELKSPNGGIIETTKESEPFRFQVGANVFEGLSLAVASMKVGEKSRFVMEPSVLGGAVVNALPKN